MKHAKDIQAKDVRIGDTFRYSSHEYKDGKFESCEEVATVTSVRTTKTGRIGFKVGDSGREWSNKPMKPTTYIQDK